MNSKLIKWLPLSTAFFAQAHAATLLDIVGSVNPTTGGEFANYSAVINGNLWGDSSVNDGTVGLSVSRTSFNNEVSSTAWNTSNYNGNGSEINFTKGSATAATSGAALTDRSFAAIKLNTVPFGSATIILNSVSVSLWRNGAQAADVYQFAYDSLGDGYDASDFIGSAVTNTTSGTSNTFTVASTLGAMSDSTQKEVRLYFWKQGTAGVSSANTHMFGAATTYTVVPEPSAAMIFVCCSLGFLMRRRKFER